MNDTDVITIVNRVLNEYAIRNQYAVTPIPVHSHTGTDSPYVDYYNLDNRPIIGSIASTGSSTRLPLTWTVSKTATGTYLITHNLGISTYITQIMIQGTAANMFSVNQTTNSFTVYTFNSAGAATDMSFNFIITLIK